MGIFKECGCGEFIPDTSKLKCPKCGSINLFVRDDEREKNEDDSELEDRLAGDEEE